MKRSALLLLSYLFTAQMAFAQLRPENLRAPAQNSLEGTSFRELVYGPLGGFVQSVFYLLILSSIVVFIWGLISYFAPGGQEPDKRKKAIFLLTWGLVAIVILISTVAVVDLVVDTFTFS